VHTYHSADPNSRIPKAGRLTAHAKKGILDMPHEAAIRKFKE